MSMGDKIVGLFGSAGSSYREPSPSEPLPMPKSAMVRAIAQFAQRSAANLVIGASRMDAWVNEVTGFGTRRDKSEHGFILPSRRLSDQELSALYHSDDIAARMVDIIPQEMMREGFMMETGDADADRFVADKFDALDVRGKFAEGMRWGRCFGGGAVVVGADDGRDAVMPLNENLADDINYLYVVDRRLLWPVSWYDEPGHPFLGLPRTYLVTTVGGTVYNTMEVHESRLIIFRGAPTGIRERMELVGWDLSVLQRAYDVLRSFNTGYRAAETLLTDGFQSIFKMTGLAEAIASKSEEYVSARARQTDFYRSVMRAIVVDKDSDEGFERTSTSFTGIPDTLDKLMLRLAAAVQIPVTILMGQSPAGMNATGESDFRWFYDRVRSLQAIELAPKLRRLTSIWLATKAGKELVKKTPEKLSVKFPPLWTETPLVQAQRMFQTAQSDQIYIQNQAISPEKVALHRFAPGGFSTDIVLSKDETEVYEKVLETDMVKMAAAAPEEASPEEKAIDEELRQPIGAGPGWSRASSPEVSPNSPDDEGTFGFKLDAASADEILAELPTWDAAKVLTMEADAAWLALEDASRIYANAPGDEARRTAMTSARDAAYQKAKIAAAAWFKIADAGVGHAPAQAGSSRVAEARNNQAVQENRCEEILELAGVSGAPGPRSLVRYDDKGGPRVFRLMRSKDSTGVSGTGHVADGVEFPDGKVALRWRGANASTTLFDNMRHAIAIHGHNGDTQAVFEDDRPREVPETSHVLGDKGGSGPID